MKLKWPKLPGPPAWFTPTRARTIHWIIAYACMGLAVVSVGSWTGIILAYFAGWHTSAALYFIYQIRMRKAFDEMAEAYRAMHDLNGALLANKVQFMLMEKPDDDSPPLSPRLQ